MGELRVEQPAYIQKNTIETTGAGDTFCACILCWNMAGEITKERNWIGYLCLQMRLRLLLQQERVH